MNDKYDKWNTFQEALQAMRAAKGRLLRIDDIAAKQSVREQKLRDDTQLKVKALWDEVEKLIELEGKQLKAEAEEAIAEFKKHRATAKKFLGKLEEELGVRAREIAGEEISDAE